MHICILTPYNLAENPRVVNEGKLLARVRETLKSRTAQAER
ncbi:MAG: hypothetical protein ACREH4_16655 [Vitreimonas sp.]